MENKTKKKLLFVITKSNWGETWSRIRVARTEADAPSQVRKRTLGASSRLIQLESVRANKWTDSVRIERFFSRKILLTARATHFHYN